MNYVNEVLSIKVSDLVPSPYNVRRYGVDQVEELAALIDSQGLLQHLIVTEQVNPKGRAGKLRFAVAAGERRRRALLLLQRRGRLSKAYEVPCELVPPERAREVGKPVLAAELSIAQLPARQLGQRGSESIVGQQRASHLPANATRCGRVPRP